MIISMRLRTILVVGLVVLTAVLSGTILAGFSLHKQEIIEQKERQTAASAQVLAHRIDRFLAQRQRVVVSRARDIRITATPDSQRASLRRLVRETDFDSASVLTTNGVRLASTDAPLTNESHTVSIKTRTDIQQALNGTVGISRPFAGADGTRVVAVSAPIYEDDVVVGALTARLPVRNPSFFDGVVGLTPDGVAGQSADRVRVTVLTQNTTLYAQDAARSTQAVDTARSSAVVGCATVTTPSPNWTVRTAMNRTAFREQLRQATVLQFAGVGVVLLVATIVGMLISRTTVRRIEQLEAGLEALGGGSYQSDLSPGVIDEWRVINERFNRLSETLKQRESQLRVLNRVLRHNLRNDMNVITAHAENILAMEAVPREAKADVEKINATAKRLIDTSDHARALYEDLLTDGVGDVTPVEVTQLVEKRVATLRAEFPECTIETDLLETAWALDTTALPLIVEEIIHNALVHNDYPEDQRKVVVRVDTVDKARTAVESDQETRIVVTDNGPGIPMVEEALLTGELDEETPVEHGSGLGVWLVNWLVDQIGGTIEAHTGVERGTTVTVHLATPYSPPEADSSGDPSERDGTGT